MFEAKQVLQRVEKMGDLFEPVLKLKQKLPRLPGLQDAKPETGIELAAQAEESSSQAEKSQRREETERAETAAAKGIIPTRGAQMAQLYVGTSGWAYPSWKPDFYPAKLAQKKFLQHYSTQLNTVEVNFTFRQLVKETTIQKWIAADSRRISASASKPIRSSLTSSG